MVENLVALCGHGTDGCHGDVEHYRGQARYLLGRHLANMRPDVVGYLEGKLGVAAAREFLRNELGNRAPD